MLIEQKINFIPHFFFEISQTCYFGCFEQTWLWPIKTILPACGKVWCLPVCKKIIFIPSLFLEILQRYYRLVILGTLCMLGHTHQKWKQQLLGNSDVYSKPKINLISQFFLDILNFKESCNLIDQEHFGPYLQNKKFARH